MNVSKLSKITALVLGFSVSSFALADAESVGQEIDKATSQVVQSTKNAMNEWSQETKEAWRQGKLESVYVLNSYLSAYDIDTEVKGSPAYLSGKVGSEVEKELAEELALSIDGINDVNNDLAVSEGMAKNEETHYTEKNKGFGIAISDATTTASIKMKLISSDVKARNIDVDTDDGHVKLSGMTESEVKAELAEQIAKNTDGVKSVENEIKVAAK